MNEATANGDAIWTRTFDEERNRGRWKRFLKLYVLPMAIVLGVGAALGGLGAFLGLLILLGIFGGMLALWIWMHGFLLRQNPIIRLVDGQLVWGQKSVPVDAIEAWTTYRDPYIPRTQFAGKLVAQVIFRVAVYNDGERATRADGEPASDNVVFGWAEMPPEELAEVRAALEPHIDAPWITRDELLA
ncbi:MAG: hypothetical protein QNJ98_20145 [Planctomycetota bacterium]|nr:hypothetical protein [Planctomycetota bacterium]